MAGSSEWDQFYTVMLAVDNQDVPSDLHLRLRSLVHLTPFNSQSRDFYGETSVSAQAQQKSFFGLTKQKKKADEGWWGGNWAQR